MILFYSIIVTIIKVFFRIEERNKPQISLDSIKPQKSCFAQTFQDHTNEISRLIAVVVAKRDTYFSYTQLYIYFIYTSSSLLLLFRLHFALQFFNFIFLLGSHMCKKEFLPWNDLERKEWKSRKRIYINLWFQSLFSTLLILCEKYNFIL